MKIRLTRTDRLIALLVANKGRKVPLPEVQHVAGAQHGARLGEAKKRGYVIENAMEHTSEGTRSWYVLLAEPGEAVPLFANPAPMDADVSVSRAELARQKADDRR